jgi:hypothetical protein
VGTFAKVVALIADSVKLSSRRLAQVDRDLAYEVVGGARYAAAAVDTGMLLLPYWRQDYLIFWDVLVGVV